MLTKTQRSKEALQHLKQLKPYDGWSIDTYTSSTGKNLVMLRRRNAPLSKSGFEDIALDSKTTGCVVGITSYIGNHYNYCRGVVLVEKDGTVARDQRDVRVTLPDSNANIEQETKKEDYTTVVREEIRRNRERARETVRPRNTPVGNAGDNGGNVTTLSDEENMKLLQYGLMAVGASVILKILSGFVFLFYILSLPLAILYAMQTCPSTDTFDAKKELKRVLRGEHLPEEHPDKPKDWLSKTVARVTASVGAELATSLGYEISFLNVFGVCTLVTVNVTAANTDVYWIGAFGTWKYLMKRERPQD